MSYKVVFDAANEPFRHLFFVAPGLLFVVVGALMVFRPQVLEAMGFRASRRFQPAFGWFFLIFAVLWTGVAGIGVVGGDLAAGADLRAGRCEVLEGRVENLESLPKQESFSLDGVRFEYSDYVVAPGFSHTAAHGGPLREGLPVRLCHADGHILRLEIGANGATPAR